ncbi:hypothetical protein PYCCODRAFT_1441144 [Trametes coccinea BRFM310]|uniref:Uncharacterized protein n=1 Tax=Trametes coccinea (strain BRFM310) TaxID=1353009 RepID=A0A1Y2I8U3_TRAC3|nr:hypothetical protein PYCCODRAFT_1441144 [Trametes coccinea BRFM310]
MPSYVEALRQQPRWAEGPWVHLCIAERCAVRIGPVRQTYLIAFALSDQLSK